MSNNHRATLHGAVLMSMAIGAATAAPTYVNTVVVSGNSTDLSGQAAGANGNRLSFGSDLYYDPSTQQYYGLADRGPGGGTIAYDTRVHNFGLTVNNTTGAISNFNMQATTLLRDQGGQTFNGLNPLLLGGTKAAVGRSLDPEGFVRSSTGTWFVSDEYGPSVREFNSAGQLIRTFTPPANLIPRETGGAENYFDGRPTITSGRQDNRGFEGLTMSPDGTKLFAILQDPLVNEGASNDGRRSQNLRIVRFDVATGLPDAQYAYTLESIADINSRIAGTANDFGATAQGRNIGVSSITAINATQFLVIERDNRGFGVDEAVAGGTTPVGSKRVYLIDISGATDISNTPLSGSNALPSGVIPVKRELYIDVQAQLEAAGVTLPEKLEGLTIGPRLADGSYSILLSTDNDFSVTQNSSGTQFDVCTSGRGATATQVTLDSGCGAGQSLIPSYLFAFRADLSANQQIGTITLAGYSAPTVPEPTTLAVLGAALAGLGLSRRRRR